MPNNRIIHYGILIVVATVLLWVGAELTKRIEWILPYTAGIGVALIVAGFIHEYWRSRHSRPASDRALHLPEAGSNQTRENR